MWIYCTAWVQIAPISMAASAPASLPWLGLRMTAGCIGRLTMCSAKSLRTTHKRSSSSMKEGKDTEGGKVDLELNIDVKCISCVYLFSEVVERRQTPNTTPPLHLAT